MSDTSAEIMPATSRAFAGMKRILFQPFDIAKWFLLGFSAWLAGLLDGGGAQVSTNNNSGNGGGEIENVIPAEWLDWMEANQGLFLGLGIGVFVLFLILIGVLLWVSSRGKFMFLDNVVHNRALIKQPWAQFKKLGNSLCLWRLGLAFVVLLIFGMIVGSMIAIFLNQGDGSGLSGLSITLLVVCGFSLLVTVIALMYISYLLENFVIPLMYQRHLLATAAWRECMALHRQGALGFVVFALWQFVMVLGVIVVVLVVGFATCCIGLIVISLPYLGAVILLPVSVFFRLLGPEFLRQFGEEYDISPKVLPPPMESLEH